MWPCGFVALVALWLCGSVAMWLCGSGTTCPCGHVAVWACGPVAGWVCDHGGLVVCRWNVIYCPRFFCVVCGCCVGGVSGVMSVVCRVSVVLLFFVFC